jgi:hypothetical protein
MPWPAARGYSAISYDPPSGSVLMVGGWNDFSLADTWRWQGNSASWAPLLVSGPPNARYGHRIVWSDLCNTQVLFGGNDGTYDNQTYLWNGTTWLEVLPGNRPGGREYHGMAYDPARGRVVVFGGRTSGNYGDTWEWDGNNWYQVTVVNPPSPRHGHSMAYDQQSQATLLFGGDGPSAQTWLWNGTAWTLQAPPQSPSARWHAAMAHDPVHGKMLLHGGWSGSVTLGDTWIWDGVLRTWTQAPAGGPGPRRNHSMTFDASRGRVILVGGETLNPGAPRGFLSDVWEWDGTSWSLARVTSPSSRIGESIAFHEGPTPATRHSIMFGGRIGPFSSNVVIGDTWLWDGTTWTQPTLATAPSARAYSDMAYDVPRGETVLFGGWTPSTLGDTWVWDGSAWSQRSPATSPSARQGHGMTFHPGLGQVLMFGGYDGSAKNDLWAWNGTDWSNITPPTGNPGARWIHGLAFDPPNNRVVLFGGWNGSSYLSDTWAWSATTQAWTQLFPTLSPSARRAHAMVFDPSRGTVVLFGGTNGGYFSDTWELRGSQWLLCGQAQPPPARDHSQLVYDPDRERLYLFGGYLLGGDFWEAFNPNPASFTEVLNSVACPVGPSGPVPTLTNNHLPWINETMQVTLSNLPTGFPLAVSLFGLAPPIAVPLPWPGCTLYTNFVFINVSVGSSQITNLPIPPLASLIGQELVCQGGSLNGPDVGLSKGYVARIGHRH